MAPDKYIHITGEDVFAENINVGGRTDIVEVDFPGERNFTLNYINIRDGDLTTVEGDEVITYELTNEPTNGYNAGNQIPTTTFLVGPFPPAPDPEPEPGPVPPPDEPEKTLPPNWVPLDEIEEHVYEDPVSYASDILYDENGSPIRKNVDGTVTVVRAITRVLPFRR